MCNDGAICACGFANELDMAEVGIIASLRESEVVSVLVGALLSLLGTETALLPPLSASSSRVASMDSSWSCICDD